jgi:hypothetical protein
MSWEDIKAKGSTKQTGLQKVVNIIMTTIAATKPLPNYGLCQVKLYQLLKFLSEQGISPSEVVLVLLNNPHLYNYVYRLKTKELKDEIIKIYNSRTAIKEEAFVALFYDNYIMAGSIFRAIRNVMRYPYEKYTIDFIKGVVTKYPFLLTTQHLEHIKAQLFVVRNGYNLVRRIGIQEVYKNA